MVQGRDPLAAGLGEVWYSRHEDGQITYTDIGYKTYKAVFERAGIDIELIKTAREHDQAVEKAVNTAKQKAD